MEGLWKIIMWIIIIILVYTAITNWGGLTTHPVQSVIDGTSDIIKKGIDISKKVVDAISHTTTTTLIGQTTTTQPQTTYGKIPCENDQQCIDTYPSCINCACINGECIGQ